MFHRKSIKDELRNAFEQGRKAGIKESTQDYETRIDRIKADYSLQIKHLEIEKVALETRIDNIKKLEDQAIEKDRKANTKFLEAQQIALSLKAVADQISEAFIRGKDDFARICMKIEEPVQKILENKK